MLYRKPVLVMLLGLIFLSFFGTLAVSAAMFPDNYDWRYRVISNLLSPRDNPHHYWLSACGVSFAALLMLPLAGYLRRHLEITSRRAALVSGGALAAGIVALICACLVVPQHTHAVLGIRRLHELLARSSAAFIAMGMLFGCWCAWKGRKRGLFWTWSLATLVPLVGLFCSECLLLLTRLEPSWAMPIRGALRHSVFWHLGFWEWTGAVAVFVFLCATVFLMPQNGTPAGYRSPQLSEPDKIASRLTALHKLHARQSPTFLYMDCENNVFSDSRDSTIIVNTPRIAPNGTKMHSMHATTNANQ
jgi:hypothetical protein